MKNFLLLRSFALAFFCVLFSACSHQTTNNDATKTAKASAAQDRIDRSNKSADSITKELD